MAVPPSDSSVNNETRSCEKEKRRKWRREVGGVSERERERLSGSFGGEKRLSFSPFPISPATSFPPKSRSDQTFSSRGVFGPLHLPTSAGTVHLRAQCSSLQRTEFDKMAACRIVDMCTYTHVESDGECTVLRSGDDDVGSSGRLSVSCRSVSPSPLIAVGGRDEPKRSLLFSRIPL